jgi:O-antigen ligase/Flp pilus assembly protein TadD
MTSDLLVRAAQLLVVLKIALVIYVFYPPAADSFALTKSSVSHVSALALAGVLIAMAIRDRRSLVITPVHLAVLALLCAFALSTAFALDQTIALFGTWRRYLGLDQLLDHAALFVGVATVFRTRRERGLLAFGLLAIAVPVCVYGAMQWTGHDFVRYIEAPGSRPIGTFGQPDTAGAFFGVVAASGAAFACWPWARWGIMSRILAGALAAVAISIGYATDTRGTFIGLGGGVAGFALISLVAWSGLELDSRRTTVAVAAGAVLAALGLFIAAPALAPLFGGSGESRLEIWQTAVRAVAARPLLGVGPDNFTAAYPSLHDIRSAMVSSSELQNSTHNAALYIATSSGLLGLLAWTAMLVLTISRGIQAAAARDPDALLVVFVAAYLGQGLVTISDLGLEWMPFVAAGLAAASWRERPITDASGPRTPWGSVLTFGAVALIAFAFLAQAQLSRLVGSQAVAGANALLASGRALPAVDYASQVVQADNRRAEHWGLFGTTLQAAGNPGAARAAYQEAAQREPWNPLYWQNIALTYLAENDEVHAVTAVDRSIAADPYGAGSRDLAARLAFNKGDWARALTDGTLAIQIDPRNLDEYEAPVRAAIHLQDWAQAESLLRTGLTEKETAHLHVLLALVYADSGRHSEAVTEIARALALAPGDPEATQLQQQIGRP